MNRILKTTMFLIIVFTTGCYYESEEKLYPVVSTDCDLTEVTFSGTIKPILQATCFTCHSNSNYLNSGGGIKLENYADIKIMAGNGKLMGAVKHENGFIPMPQGGGKLTACEISQLQKWIDNGTLNN
ncbi:MAG: hypothetical protein Q7W54_13250 [Bacteroidota bacterium]|nr:hypothetical protein [Bacteroidota bacterium]